MEVDVDVDYVNFVCPVCEADNKESWLQVDYDVQCWQCGALFDVNTSLVRVDKALESEPDDSKGMTEEEYQLRHANPYDLSDKHVQRLRKRE